MINQQESINLKRLVSESDSIDNTEQIRTLKHSSIIRRDSQLLTHFINENSNDNQLDPVEFEQQCRDIAPLLSVSYNDLFMKIMKKEMNFTILTRLLDVLFAIEEMKVDQHEGSVLVGKILKELYIDSALRRCESLDREHAEDKSPLVEGLNISWSQYRNSIN